MAKSGIANATNHRICSVLFQSFMLLCAWGIVQGDVFSSTPQLAELFRFERRLLQRAQSYVDTAQKRLEIFKRVSEDFDNLMLESTNNITHKGCALTADQDDSAATVTRDRWTQMGGFSRWNPFLDLVQEVGTTWMSYVPDMDSISGSLQSVVRLVDLYQLDTSDLSHKGRILGRFSTSALSPEDCRNLAIAAISSGYFKVANKLVSVAMEMKPEETWIEEISKLRRLLEVGQAEMDAPEETSYIDDEGEAISDEENVLDDIEMNDLELRLSWAHEDDPTLAWKESIQTYDPEQGFQIPEEVPLKIREYQALCRGERVKYDVRLTCYIRHGVLPYYYWWRVETLQSDPSVVMFYDFITDEEANALKTVVNTSMTRSRVIKKEGGAVSHVRLGKTAWIDNADIDRWANGLNVRITQATGLDSVNYAEHLQMSVYGLGGMYEPHYDYSRATFKYGETEGRRIGDRLATFMMYLSDVIAGGATVFPMWRVAAFPVKNAALFWFNQYKDGTSNPTSIHAGCPVLIGHKWVANKWIHEYGQEFRYPCSLNMDSPLAHRIPEDEEKLFQGGYSNTPVEN